MSFLKSSFLSQVSKDEYKEEKIHFQRHPGVKFTMGNPHIIWFECNSGFSGAGKSSVKSSGQMYTGAR